MTDHDFAARLRAAVDASDFEGARDNEAAHSAADAALLETLEALGMHETVKAWREVTMWYA